MPSRYNCRVDNVYLGLSFKDFTIERGLHHLEAVLQLFPQSAAQPGFRLVVRSLGPEESPTLERDLIASPVDVRALAGEFLHEDTVYEVTAYWDLWQPPAGRGDWKQAPSPVEFVLEGKEYDPSRDAEAHEHIVATLGPEDLYLSSEEPQDDSGPRRENARRLHAFLRDIQKSLPLASHTLWSEGREDFAESTRRLVSQA